MGTRDVADQAYRNTLGNIHYLIYRINDRVSFGQRAEWLNYGGAAFAADNDDLYNYTVGLNYRPRPNLTFRPEIRTVWDHQNYGFNENGRSTQTAFGGDMAFTF